MKKTQILSGIVAGLVCALPAQAVQSDYIGQAWFPQGDSIEITAVGRNENLLTVAGRYNLVSHERATLRLYITTTNKNAGEGKSTPLEIARGRGDFALAYGPLVAGLPHVSMYPVQGGESFASLYFGTKEEAAEERRMKLGRESGGERGGSSPTAAPLTLESAPPVVVRTKPVAGAAQVDPRTSEIVVQFSKKMQDGGWSWTTWGEENFPEMTGQPRYLPDGRTCVLPVKLQPGKFYATWLNSDKFRNFKDAGDRAAVPYLLTFRTRESSGTAGGGTAADFTQLLNDDQRAVLGWTDRQFRSFFDARTFDDWSDEERAALERKLIDALNGPRSTEYYQAINTLAAMRSMKALPRLREIATERVDRNNRDRWMAIRALGIIGDKESVPELIHLVYHGNVNTRWWAQISLVQITGKNFGKDWNAWSKWWNGQNGQPPYKPEIIRWWNGQAEPDKLAESLEKGDQTFFESLKPKSAAASAPTASTEVAARLRNATPLMDGIRESWSSAVQAMQRDDATSASGSLRILAPRIQEFVNLMKGTALEAGAAESLETLKSLMKSLEKGDKDATQTALAKMTALGQSMERQVKTFTDTPPVPAAKAVADHE